LSEADMTRKEAVLKRIEFDEDSNKFIKETMNNIENYLDKKNPFKLALEAFTDSEKSNEATKKMIEENEEFQRNATVAEKFDNLYISKFYKLLSYGLLVRASESELEKIDKSEKQTEKYKKLEEAFETAKKALKDLSENLEKEINYQVVPIKKLVSIQLECGLIMADYLNRN
jgi:hypothetical protein